MKTGPIISIEDDLDDQEVFADALAELKVQNKVIFFTNGIEALEYLRTTVDQPFIIFCDINLPNLNGIEIRNEIFNDDYLRKKSIPFIFMTTSSDLQVVREAYNLSIQGFFTKPLSMKDIIEDLKEILNYWSKCKHPNG